jgi:hypothetical protein
MDQLLTPIEYEDVILYISPGAGVQKVECNLESTSCSTHIPLNLQSAGMKTMNTNRIIADKSRKWIAPLLNSPPS